MPGAGSVENKRRSIDPPENCLSGCKNLGRQFFICMNYEQTFGWTFCVDRAESNFTIASVIMYSRYDTDVY